MGCRCTRSLFLFAFISAAYVAIVFLGVNGPRASAVTTNSRAEMSWKLDPVHCMAVFRIQHMGAGMFWGKFNDVSGTVSYPEDGSEAPKFNVSVAVESVDTGTAKLDKTIKGPQFFNAKEWEEITFSSTGAEKIDEKTWKVKGDFTMHGVTKPIEAMVEVTGVIGSPVQKKAGFEAVFTIKRSDFGMNWGVKNRALGDDVRLVVGLEGDWVR